MCKQKKKTKKPKTKTATISSWDRIDLSNRIDLSTTTEANAAISTFALSQWYLKHLFTTTAMVLKLAKLLVGICQIKWAEHILRLH